MPLEPEVPRISPVVSRLFARVVKRYFRKHFRSVMGQRLDVLEGVAGPLVIYANHSSWWDPMLCVLLARMLMPAHRHYAPMDAEALKRYPILAKIGIFPVDQNSRRGAVDFLQRSEAILRDGGVLWVTPQGRFADMREFPLAFRPGLAALAKRVPAVPMLPLAIEYVFWDERLPETLCRFGEPLFPAAAGTSEGMTRALEAALAAAMLDLQKASCARDASAFRTLLSGARGTGGVYGLLRWLRRAPADHTPRS